MSRRRWRSVMTIFLLGVALLLIYLGPNGWVVNRTVPAQYIGFLLLAFWVAGLSGVNIWSGGPLDPRRDPPPTSGRRDESPEG